MSTVISVYIYIYIYIHTYIQSAMSHDPSEIILIFAAQETFINVKHFFQDYKVQNNCFYSKKKSFVTK